MATPRAVSYDFDTGKLPTEVSAAVAALVAPAISAPAGVEAVQDVVGGMLVSGGSLTLAYDDTTGKVTLTGSGGDAETIRDTIGAAIVGAAGVTVAVNDAADTITLGLSGVTISQVTDLATTLAGKLNTADVTDATAVDVPFTPPTGMSSTNVGAALVELLSKIGSGTSSGTAYTDEQAQDAVAALFAGTQSGITFTYDDAGNKMTAQVTAAGYTDDQAKDAEWAALAAGVHTGITPSRNTSTKAISLAVTSAPTTSPVVLSGGAPDAVTATVLTGGTP